jgi:single-stranded-DNA-specific exonuclease
MESLTRRNWRIRELDYSLNVPERLRLDRGIANPEDEVFHDPYLLKDMEKASQRIRKAIRDKEQIFIFGDYDADGICGTSLLKRLLQKIGGSPAHLLPHRVKDGYGLKPPIIERLIKSGCQLLITVDNGTTAVDAVALARQHGIDTIIIDHHEQLSTLPEAYAILNPKQPGCPYPFKKLAAVGVAFKLAQVLDPKGCESLLDLVAIATVADMVPLIDENRLLVIKGLEIMQQGSSFGTQALIRVSQDKAAPINSHDLGWKLGPRINSAGRLADANLALKLLLAPNRREAEDLAYKLNQLNLRRRELQQIAVNDTLKVLKSQKKSTALIIVVGDDWNLGVIGLIAGNLLREFNKPVIVFSRVLGNGIVKGSARSPQGFNIGEAIAAQSDLLLEYGGHKEAAGLGLKEEFLEEFSSRIIKYATDNIDEALNPELELDGELRSSEMDLRLLAALRALEPFGMQNQRPLFYIPDCRVMRKFEMSQGRHLKLWLEKDNVKVEAVWWRCGSSGKKIKYGDMLDLAAEPTVNEWQGKKSLQLKIEDVRRKEITFGGH